MIYELIASSKNLYTSCQWCISEQLSL